MAAWCLCAWPTVAMAHAHGGDDAALRSHAAPVRPAPLDTTVAMRDGTADWMTLGRVWFAQQRYRAAAGAFGRAMQLRMAAPADAAWQIARSYAALANRTQAVRWLRHARQLGFTDEQAARTDPVFRKYWRAPRLRCEENPHADRTACPLPSRDRVAS
jgi:hypothetical protein